MPAGLNSYLPKLLFKFRTFLFFRHLYESFTFPEKEFVRGFRSKDAQKLSCVWESSPADHYQSQPSVHWSSCRRIQTARMSLLYGHRTCVWESSILCMTIDSAVWLSLFEARPHIRLEFQPLQEHLWTPSSFHILEVIDFQEFHVGISPVYISREAPVMFNVTASPPWW